MTTEMVRRYAGGVSGLPQDVVSYIEQRYTQNDSYKVDIAREATRKFKVKVLPEYVGVLAEIYKWPKRPTQSGRKGGKPKNYVHGVGLR